MRRLIVFDCEHETLVASLDEASGATALLIVSGGNEIRAGAHRGMALLAARLAADGVPVMRFDRRGVGESTGGNGGYASSEPDIAAATQALRRELPHVTRIVGFGNCDAASALALFGRAAGIDALVLANPWVIETDDLPPAAAIRRRYANRLRDPRSWWRLMTGAVSFTKLVRGLGRIAVSEPQQLANRVIAAIERWGSPATIVLAQGDATAIAFAHAAAARNLPTRIDHVDTASHSFARVGDAAALEAAIRRALDPIPPLP